MPETSGFEPNFFVQENKEIDLSRVRVIVIRGLEDFSQEFTEGLGRRLKVDVFNPQWRTEESLADKVGRLDTVVQQAVDEGKQPIVIGLSAGAALMETYMLLFHHKVRHGYSVSGLLNPDLNNPELRPKLDELTRDSPGFKYVAEFLTEKLTPAVIEALHLPQKISAYNSPDDEIVPNLASNPEWIDQKKFHNVKKGNHVGSIVKALVTDISSQIGTLKSEAKFD